MRDGPDNLTTEGPMGRWALAHDAALIECAGEVWRTLIYWKQAGRHRLPITVDEQASRMARWWLGERGLKWDQKAIDALKTCPLRAELVRNMFDKAALPEWRGALGPLDF